MSTQPKSSFLAEVLEPSLDEVASEHILGLIDWCEKNGFDGVFECRKCGARDNGDELDWADEDLCHACWQRSHGLALERDDPRHRIEWLND